MFGPGTEQLDGDEAIVISAYLNDPFLQMQ